MTPEEKQAIIDKALELGFYKHPRSKYLYVFNINSKLYYYYALDMAFGEFNKGYKDSNIINSPSDLETLFNAIVS